MQQTSLLAISQVANIRPSSVTDVQFPFYDVTASLVQFYGDQITENKIRSLLD
jgi:hypothetical protein